MSAIEIAAGSHLIAGPDLLDPNFRRTVVLVCEHTESGSLGLVINRPTAIGLDRLVPALSLPEVATPGGMATVYCGGPVESNRLMIVRFGAATDPGEDVQEVCPGVHLVADISATLERLRESHDDLARYRFFLGYSGWGKGQLEGEMREGAWLLRDADPGRLFEAEGEDVWRRALEKLGGIYTLYAQMPHDPSMN